MALQEVASCWLVLPVAAVLCIATGCGPLTYTLDATRAERLVAQARADNASYYAPYELSYAEAYLAKAHEEAAEGEYEDALNALTVATAYGRRALTRSTQPGSLDR
jgi:hypothetical protein